MKTVEQMRAIGMAMIGVMSRGEAWCYVCQNDKQDLTRVSTHMGDDEVQVNFLRHSEGWHRHDCDMTSVILEGGYTWQLRQDGAVGCLEMFASPGSVVRMSGKDAHAVLRGGNGGRFGDSMSLCVFEEKSYWHRHYELLDGIESSVFCDLAIAGIARWLRDTKEGR